MQTLRRKAGISDDAWADRLERDAGVRSTKLVPISHARQIIDRLKSETGGAAHNPRMAGPFAPKLRALWIAGWNLGVVFDRSDNALIAFVKRQTGIEPIRFLQNSEDAFKAVEGLKQWLSRHARVDWTLRETQEEFQRNPRFQVLLAQWGLYHQLGGDEWPGLEALIFKYVPRGTAFNLVRNDDWQAVSNALGAEIRKLKSERKGKT